MATRKVAEHQLAENGDIIQFRDIDLASADKQTTVGTTDSVILEGEDGVFHKIKKASFNEAVRDALGALVSNLDKGAASTNKVLATDANNDLGTMTPANLASVLSAIKGEVVASGGGLDSNIYPGSYGTHIYFDAVYRIHFFMDAVDGNLYSYSSNSSTIKPSSVSSWKKLT